MHSVKWLFSRRLLPCGLRPCKVNVHGLCIHTTAAACATQTGNRTLARLHVQPQGGADMGVGVLEVARLATAAADGAQQRRAELRAAVAVAGGGAGLRARVAGGVARRRQRPAVAAIAHATQLPRLAVLNQAAAAGPLGVGPGGGLERWSAAAAATATGAAAAAAQLPGRVHHGVQPRAVDAVHDGGTGGGAVCGDCRRGGRPLLEAVHRPGAVPALPSRLARPHAHHRLQNAVLSGLPSHVGLREHGWTGAAAPGCGRTSAVARGAAVPLPPPLPPALSLCGTLTLLLLFGGRLLHLQGVLRQRASAGHTAGAVGTRLAAVAAGCIIVTSLQAVPCTRTCDHM